MYTSVCAETLVHSPILRRDEFLMVILTKGAAELTNYTMTKPNLIRRRRQHKVKKVGRSGRKRGAPVASSPGGPPAARSTRKRPTPPGADGGAGHD
ncbi:unnamed protein product [Pieris brassicae]|uniref:Uncharacterized protein n=1 Tax=Pieris brassicae TaxID=7116 RepID=A0A9P0TMP4_PIEBR|nr:unnamed protein product [Pieris brassicae]